MIRRQPAAIDANPVSRRFRTRARRRRSGARWWRTRRRASARCERMIGRNPAAIDADPAGRGEWSRAKHRRHPHAVDEHAATERERKRIGRRAQGRGRQCCAWTRQPLRPRPCARRPIRFSRSVAACSSTACGCRRCFARLHSPRPAGSASMAAGFRPIIRLQRALARRRVRHHRPPLRRLRARVRNLRLTGFASMAAGCRRIIRSQRAVARRRVRHHRPPLRRLRDRVRNLEPTGFASMAADAARSSAGGWRGLMVSPRRCTRAKAPLTGPLLKDRILRSLCERRLAFLSNSLASCN